MSDKYTNQQVAQTIDVEGWSYAVRHYMGPESIEDPELAKAWQDCRDAMNRIDELLDPEATW